MSETQIDSAKILLDFLEAVSLAESMAEVSMAAGVAQQDLLGLPREPHPEG
jgi:hypothetical protein